MMILLGMLATLAALAAAGFFSGSEMGLYCINRVRLRLRSERPEATDARALSSLVARLD
ncbi:MAG: hypothetical protein GX616_05995 [Planctomycetes bacterium]|nr:hypothetical protein [Planctomycetota bacterium]